MSEEWIGARVSLDCGAELGYFQGLIKNVNVEEKTLVLEKPFQNGVASRFPSITIKSSDIKVCWRYKYYYWLQLNLMLTQNLKILPEPKEEKHGGSSVVQVQRKKGRAVAENLTKTKVQNL